MYNKLVRSLLGKFNQNPKDLEELSYNTFNITPDIGIYGSSCWNLVHFTYKLNFINKLLMQNCGSKWKKIVVFFSALL